MDKDERKLLKSRVLLSYILGLFIYPILVIPGALTNFTEVFFTLFPIWAVISGVLSFFTARSHNLNSKFDFVTYVVVGTLVLHFITLFIIIR